MAVTFKRGKRVASYEEATDAILALCTEKQRERFLLYALYEYTYEEIGKICGCTKGAVQTSIEAVRKKFQKFWK